MTRSLRSTILAGGIAAALCLTLGWQAPAHGQYLTGGLPIPIGGPTYYSPYGGYSYVPYSTYRYGASYGPYSPYGQGYYGGGLGYGVGQGYYGAGQVQYPYRSPYRGFVYSPYGSRYYH